MNNDLFNSTYSETNNEMSELIIIDNDEIAGDDGFLDNEQSINDIIVYSRDWTVETVVNQIEKGNIDLNPQFQRRNAWNDSKKSSLIESYLMGYPVPEIVLAEHPREKRKFIVIDGKQRLLTLCGFLMHEKYGVWKKPVLKDLKALKNLNGMKFEDFKSKPILNKYLCQLANSDVRCTVISNVKNNDDVLYDIFYRLNAGATPLSIQELRQVLYNGDFTKFLIQYTSEINEFHRVLNLNKPDDRLKDVEITLRVLSMINNINNYRGNLKKHLDEYTVMCNDNWGMYEFKVADQLVKIESVIKLLSDKLQGVSYVGRKWNEDRGKFDTRFNTVLFEVQVYFAYFGYLELERIPSEKYIESFKKLCEKTDFISSISSSTKNIKEYSIRYGMYSKMFVELTGKSVDYPWE